MSLRTAYLLAVFIFIADQVVKWAIINPIDLYTVRNIEILPFFDLTWVENRGISMGLLQADSELARWLLTGATALIAAGVGYWITKEEHRWDRIGLAMILGGALGNIVDRVRFGYVVDFLDLHFGTFRPFFVFNIADAAISIGVVILLIRAFFFSSGPKENENA